MRQSAAILAIDVGTSSCKGALYSIDGERLAIATRAYEVTTPQPGFAEQCPEDYLTASQFVCRELATAEADIAAVSFSTQTPTLVLCDESLRAIGPAIIWQDSRAGEQAELLRTRY